MVSSTHHHPIPRQADPRIWLVVAYRRYANANVRPFWDLCASLGRMMWYLFWIGLLVISVVMYMGW